MKLINTVIVAALMAFSPLSAEASQGGVFNAVTQAAVAYGIPPALAHGIVRVESGYNCGARHGGLMQVTGPTARSMGVRGSLSSCANSLTAGMRYLKMAYDRGGDWCAVATAYNTGMIGTHRCSSYGRRVLAKVARAD